MTNKTRFEGSLRTVVKFSIVVLIGLFFSKIFTYGIKVLLARNLGPEIYGLFSLASAILLLFVYLFAMGLPEGILRFSSFYNKPKEKKKAEYMAVFSLKLLLISSVIGGITLFLLSETISLKIFHDYQLTYFLRGFSIIIPFYIGMNLFLGLLRGNQKIVHYSLILNILHPGVNFALLGALIFLGYTSNSIVLSYIISTIFAFSIAYIICKNTIFKKFDKINLPKKEKRELLKSLFNYSWPLVFSAMLLNLFAWTDSFVIGYFKTATEVGYYNVAVTLANLFSLVPAIIGPIFYPLAVKEFSRKRINIVRDLSKQITKWIFIINLPLLIICMLFPGAIINLLFGSEYLLAENALRILSLGTFSISIMIISTDLMSMAGKSKTILLNITIVNILNFVLNIIFIPKYGINGAASSTAISMFTLGILLTIESKYFLSFIPIKRKIIKIFLISIIPSFVLFYLRDFLPKTLISLGMQVVLFVLIYFIILFISNIFDQSDIMIIKSIKNKIKNIR